MWTMQKINRRINQKVSKRILMLWKGVFPYEYMDSWEKFDENTLPPKEASCSNLNLEDIRLCPCPKSMGCIWKNLGKYHDLYA